MNPPSNPPRWRWWLNRLLQVAGWLFVLQLLLALTGLPRPLTNWLNATDRVPQETPRYIVVLGGGGIPSGSSLMRTYSAAQYGAGLTGTTFVVALPADADPDQNSVGRMRDELVRRGIPASAILLESKGRNTREQARNVAAMLGTPALDVPILLVSSDYHLRRATLCFHKAGFSSVAALNSASIGAEADPGMFSGLRYGLWGNAVANIKISRELVALAVGKLTGQF